MNSYQVKLIKNRNGVLQPLFLNRRTQMPMPMANLWGISYFRDGRSFNTTKAFLNDLKLFYEWCDTKEIDPYVRFSNSEGFSRAEIRNLSDYLQNYVKKEGQVKPSTYQRRVTAIRDFCEFQMERYLDMAIHSNDEFLKGNIKKERLSRHFERVSIDASHHENVTKPISEDVLKIISSIIHPSSECNPFKNTAHRVRNFCMFHVAVDAWLRRSELVLLELDDVDLAYPPTLTIKHPTSNAKADRKDGASLKTMGKVVPINSDLQELLAYYIEEVRPTFINIKSPSRALFLSERDGRRLSTQSFNSIIQTINASLPELSSLNQKLHPHMLRATGATGFRKKLAANPVSNSDLLNHGMVQDIMTYMGGWSNRSTMPGKYSREAIRAKIFKLVNQGK